MKVIKATIVLGIVSLMFACDRGKDENILVDGSEIPPLPASAIKEPYPDNENMVKVTISNQQGNITNGGDYYYSMREGTWLEYFPNGFPKTITSYVNGVKQGMWLSLDNRGQLLERAFYHNDKLNGTYIKYNRTRIKEEKFYQNGVLEGPLKKYYDTGKIMEESNFENGKLNGIARWYDQDGNITIEYEYKDGEWINPEGGAKEGN